MKHNLIKKDPLFSFTASIGILLHAGFFLLLFPSLVHAESPNVKQPLGQPVQEKNDALDKSKSTFVPEKLHPIVPFTSGCPGTVALIFDDGLTLTPPRNWSGMYYYTMDGKVTNSLDPHHPAKDCSFKNVEKVKTFTTGSIASGNKGFSVSLIDKKFNTIFDNKPIKYSDVDQIKKLAQQQPGSADKIKKIIFKDEEVYILPIDEAKTFDSEPVILRCNGSGRNPDLLDKCRATYLLPDGHGFAYSFYRKYYREEDYLLADQQKRREYESVKHQ